MTPGARCAAAIEILAEIFDRRAAADRVLAAWGRDHRFAGSKDRHAIADRVYTVLRRLNECAVRMHGERTPRALVIGSLAVADGASLEAIEPLFSGTAHDPSPLTEAERKALAASAAAIHPWDRLNYPEWLHPQLVAAWGDELEKGIAALNERAPLDLRVNTLKASRGDVLAALDREHIGGRATSFAPHGVRLPPGSDTQITQSDLFKSGRVEIQDEASQICVALARAKPGQVVVDLAAGAGGKSLALAAAMANRGRVLACDVDAVRLKNLTPRAARAGAGIIELAGDPYGEALAAGSADIVLIDAPCSGTGTWRRNPEARWTLTPERLAEHHAAQRRLLDRAVEIVKKDGRIVFATCSLLPSEGAEQIAAFRSQHPNWNVRPAAETWRQAVGSEPPPGVAEFARLAPHRDKTDGFFVAVLEGRP